MSEAQLLDQTAAFVYLADVCALHDRGFMVQHTPKGKLVAPNQISDEPFWVVSISHIPGSPHTGMGATLAEAVDSVTKKAGFE